jgi:hypothetical protein
MHDVGMFTNYLYTKYHMPNSIGSLLIATEPNAKENICMAAMFLFHIL